MAGHFSRWGRVYGFAGLALLIPFGAAFRQKTANDQANSTRNYDVMFGLPTGWKERPHGPQSLMVAQHPSQDAQIRLAINQMVADINPTPDMDTNGLAEQVVFNTNSNLPGWKGRVWEDVETTDGRYRMVHRSGPDRTVITAFQVRGNTTVMVSLIGLKAEKDNVERHMPKFRDYLGTLKLQEADLQKRFNLPELNGAY